MLSFSVAHANPINPEVVAGSAGFRAQGSLLEITNSPGTIINWQEFSIAADETTKFIQQSAASAVLNRVTGASVSTVLGTLQSNGQVFVINPNGLLIGENAFIDTAGFVGSTLDIDDQAFLDKDYQFTGNSGVVENQGLIQVTGSGDVVLLGTSVENSGIIRTEEGDIVLAAGRSIALTYDDVDNIVFKLRAPEDAVLNLGDIVSDAGNIALAGGQIHQQGDLRLARSADGRIFLEAGTQADVSGSIDAPGGQIVVLGEHIALQDASLTTSSAGNGGEVLIGGDYQGGGGLRTATTTSIDAESSISANADSAGNGGRVIVWSDQHTKVSGSISARAAGTGGDGGFVETSSAGQLDVDGSVSVVDSGGEAGEWLLDPEDIVIDEGMASSIEGTLNEGGNVTVKTADQGDGEGNITVAAPITKTAGDDASLTLDAHNDIDVNAPIKSESNKLDVTLKAGRSVDVNAEITTNGGNFATIISGTSSDSETSDAEDAGSGDVESNTEAEQPESADTASEETETEQADDGSDSSEEIIAEEAGTEESPTEEVDQGGDNADSSSVEVVTADQQTEEPATESSDETEVVADTGIDESAEAETAQENDTSTEVVSTTDDEAVEQLNDNDSDSGEVADAPVVENDAADEVLAEHVEIVADEVQVIISAGIETAGGNIAINAGSQAGVVIASTLDASNMLADQVGGSISVETGTFQNTADIVSTGQAQGGNISINAEHSTALGADLIVDGGQGGDIEIHTGNLSLAETISARGTDGDGGRVELNVDGRSIETNTSNIDVSGNAGGSIRHTAGHQITSSGTYIAIGRTDEGGSVDISAPGTKLLSASIDASGESAGGRVRVGGEFQGGKNLSEDELPNAQLLAINDGVEIRADGLGAGSDGGRVILWADQEAAVYGTVSASQNRDAVDPGAGGFVEISSGENLTYAGNVTAGLGGTVLFDPKNIVIDDNPVSSQYGLILGFNYDPLFNSLDNSDLFGTSISLSADGTRLAVGAALDDGFGNATLDSGAVYLFSFSDENFSGGVLESTVGKGYVGGKNMDITNLGANDNFGTSVDFDADGDSLAVGAWRDEGLGNTSGSNTGAVYLIKFNDTSFNGGNVEAIFGTGYGSLGGKNRSFGSGLESQNGRGVALNAAGDRLAIGSVGDNRFGPTNFYEGAVYLFTFTDDEFSGGTQVSKIADFSPSGNPAPGPNDLNLTFLDQNDYFGEKLDLNAAGDRLVVSAIGDDGFGQQGFFPLTGAVHLFSFSDTNFSNPTLEGTIGRGYTGGKNFDPGDIAQDGNEFASSVSINAAGDRIAVTGDFDDGFGNGLQDSGVVRIFDFSDTNFNGVTEERRIGFGYTGNNNVNVTDLDIGDRAVGVALNGDGDRLAAGWFLDDGAANAAPNSGAVRFFDLNLPGSNTGDVVDAVFANSPGSDITLTPTSITDITDTGSAVVLQANNDISVFSPILADNPSGDGGDLTFQAGRSIHIDAQIDTDNGNFTAIANEIIANGAVDAHRDPGPADILINADINTGTGDVLLRVSDDPNKNDNARGVISIQQAAVTGNNVTIDQGNNVQLGDSFNSTPSLIDATGNVDIMIDGEFLAQGGNAPISGGTIEALGDVSITAGGIDFSGDIGARGINANGIDLSSGSTIEVSGGELVALQDIVIASVGDATVQDSATNQFSLIQSILGSVDLSSDANAHLLDGVLVDAIEGNIAIATGQDLNLIAGSSFDSDVHLLAIDINIDSGGNVLLQGGSGTSADALIDASGTANINAVGDVTVQGGTASGANAVVYSDSLNTVNIDAANVYLLSGAGQGLVNVLDGATGSTVNITTPGDCINCIQVGLADPQGVVADTLNIFGQPEPPVEPPVAPAPVAPAPVVVVEESQPIVSEPPAEQPEPEPQPAPEPEEEIAELPDDVINDVVVINENSEESTTETEDSVAATSEEDEDNDESEETPTQCEA